MSQSGVADLHVHTDFSDGWPSPQSVIDRVRWAGQLNTIAITDHDTIEGALVGQEYAATLPGAPLVIVGEEVSSKDGHILGLFLHTRIPPGMPAAVTVAAIHEQQGVAIAAHPCWRVERPGSGGKIHGVGWIAAQVPFDAIEVENATPGMYLYNQMAHRLQEALGLPQVGNSDAHILDAIGRAYTTYPGHGEADLRAAIRTRATLARRERYQTRGLALYAAYTLHRQAVKQAARIAAAH
ncbi:MAG: PHP-associated domain-containing protein [Candidatus Dormibacteraceae bacterium]